MFSFSNKQLLLTKRKYYLVYIRLKIRKEMRNLMKNRVSPNIFKIIITLFILNKTNFINYFFLFYFYFYPFIYT